MFEAQLMSQMLNVLLSNETFLHVCQVCQVIMTYFFFHCRQPPHTCSVRFLFVMNFLPDKISSKEKHAKNKNADKSKGTTKETSLRERAVAKLKILNFNINWDVHMKPCG